MSLLEQADLGRVALAVFFPEKRLLHQVRLNAGGIDHDERRALTLGVFVDETRHKFLTCPSRAGNHDPRIGRRDTVHGRAQ